MSGGLSTANFMSGLASGLNTGMGLIDARRRHEREDKAAERADKEFARKEALWAQQDKQLARQDVLNERQDTQWQQKQDDRKRKELEKQLEMDLRGINQGIVKFDGDFIGKYKDAGLGIDRIGDPQWRAQSQDAGRAIIDAMDEFDVSGAMGEKALVAINKMLQPELDLRTQKDGLGRRVKAARKLPDGRTAFELEVIGKDGKPYIAPLTKQGTSSMEDEVIAVSSEKMQEWATAGLHKANAAYLVEQAGGDNKKIAELLSKFVLGKSLEPKAEYSYKQGYDQNGNKTLYQFDGRGGATQVGGSAAPDKTKLSAADKGIRDAMEQYQKDFAQYGPDTANASLKTRLGGVTVEAIQKSLAVKRLKGDLTPINAQDIAVIQAANAAAAVDGGGDGDTDNNTGTGVTHRPPPKASGAGYNNPLYPDAARRKAELDMSQGDSLQRYDMGISRSATPQPQMSRQQILQQRLNQAKTPGEQQAILREMADLAANQGMGL